MICADYLHPACLSPCRVFPFIQLTFRSFAPAAALVCVFGVAGSIRAQGVQSAAEMSLSATTNSRTPILEQVVSSLDTVVLEGTGLNTGDPNARGRFVLNGTDAKEVGFGNGRIIEGRHLVESDTWKMGSNFANGNKGTWIAGSYGHLYLRADGSWAYELDNDNPDTDALMGISAAEDRFVFRVYDGEGEGVTRYTNKSKVTITITGVIDTAPFTIPISSVSASVGKDGEIIFTRSDDAETNTF